MFLCAILLAEKEKYFAYCKAKDRYRNFNKRGFMKAKSYILLFFAEFAFYLSGYVVHTAAGRILGPQEYGRYGLVVTLTLLVANLIGSGVPIAMSKFLSEAKAKYPEKLLTIKRKGAQAQTLVTVIFTAIFFFLASPIARFLGDETLSGLFRLSAWIIPCYAIDSFYFYFFSGLQRFGIQSSLKLTRSFLRVTVILVLAYMFGTQGIIIGYMAVPVGVFLLALAIDRAKPLPRIAEGVFQGRVISFQTIFSLAFPVTIFLVLFEILMSFDLYALKYFFQDDAMVGQYNAALTLARIPSFLFYALTIILLPAVADSVARVDFGRTKMVVQNSLRFMALILFPLVAVVWAYPESLITMFFGNEFSVGAKMLPSLTTALSIFSILYVMAFAYKGAEKIRVPIFFVLGSIVANGVLNFFGIPYFGSQCVGEIKLVVALGVLPFFLLSLKRTFGVQMVWREVFWISLFSLCIFLSARFFGKDEAVSLFVCVFVCSIFYPAFLFLFGVLTQEDIRLFGIKKRP